MDHHDMGFPDEDGPGADRGMDRGMERGFDSAEHEFGMDGAGLDSAGPFDAEHQGDQFDADHEGGFGADGPELTDADTTDPSFAADYGGMDQSGELPGALSAGAGLPPVGHDPHLSPVPLGYEDLYAGRPGEDLHALAAATGVPFGADPDLCPFTSDYLPDGADPADDFPQPLGLDLPEPVDGFPWVDPAVLGHDLLPAPGDIGGVPTPDELFDYAGEQLPVGADAWGLLVGSPDPATSALARWWSPGRG